MQNLKWKYSKFLLNKNYKFNRNYVLKYLPSNLLVDSYKKISKWKGYSPTPLLNLNKLNKILKLNNIFYKDESKRFHLKSFKALGGAYAVEKISKSKKKITVSSATAGNHGRSVAWGAKRLKLGCKIFVSHNVSQTRINEIKKFDAQVIKVKGNYEDSLKECQKLSKINNWNIVQDVSTKNYKYVPQLTMAGYSIMIKEISKQTNQYITHIFIQAGVGGLAASFASYCRKKLGYSPIIIIVEPDYAPCLQKSIVKGKPVVVKGQASDMGRLDCKYPSRHAFYSLSETANAFVSITETESTKGNQFLSKRGIHISQSSSAGFVALSKLIKRGDFLLDSETHALCVFSEGDVK